MPVGAGSIKRAAETATAKPEVGSKEAKQAEVMSENAKSVLQDTTHSKTPAVKSAAPKKKQGSKSETGKNKSVKAIGGTGAEKPSKASDRQEQELSRKGEFSGNQMYQITDELPVHLL